MSDRPTIDDLRQQFLAGLGPKSRERVERGARPRHSTRPNGYAATPGTGPEGETCGSCRHAERFRASRNYYKCGLVRHTGGRGSDIALRAKACSAWKPQSTEGGVS